VTELEEQEVDFGRYRRQLAARWWLLVGGLVAGLAVGLVLAAAGGSVWKASALISLGQPFSPGGGSPVVSFATNPRAVAEIVRSESALKEAARASGMQIGNLRGHVSSAQVGAGTGAAAARSVTLMQVTVQGPKPAKVEAAAKALARVVIDSTTKNYVGTKIAALRRQLTSLKRQIAVQSVTVKALQNATNNNESLSPLDRLALVTQLNGAVQLLGQLQGQQSNAQQQLALGLNVESATIVRQPAAVKTTARSTRTSLLVGGLIGLLLGAAAALAWDALARLAPRR
jgi:hypothetical protein